MENWKAIDISSALYKGRGSSTTSEEMNHCVGDGEMKSKLAARLSQKLEESQANSEPRNIEVTLTLSRTELEIFDAIAKEYGRTKDEILREHLASSIEEEMEYSSD